MTGRHTRRAIVTLAASALVTGFVSFSALQLVRRPQDAAAATFDSSRTSATTDLRAVLESITPAAPAISDPRRLLAQALTETGTAERRAAVARVGAAWAASDPQAAWTAADDLPREVRERYRRAVLEEWVRLDSDAAIGLLERIDPAILPRGLPLAPFVAADAGRMLELGARLPTDLRRSVEGAALRAIAHADPLAAIRLVERLPPSLERDASLSEAATRYAELDSEAAIRWARSLSPAPPSVVSAVAATIAYIDIERAVELALEWDVALSADVPIGTRVAIDPARAHRVADELAARNDARARALLDAVVGAWWNIDAEAAFDWIAAHPEAADAFDLRFIARRIGGDDPDVAARRIDDLPQALREEWAVQMATWYMEHGVDRAADWLERFRGEPAYDAALGPLVARGARVDPRLTARLLEGAGRAMRRVGSEQLAAIWATAEPTVAAQWAASLAISDLRATAVTAAARAWAARDAAAAQRWLSSLPDAPADIALPGDGARSDR